MERVYALPAESKHFHLFTRDSDIKGHQAYSAGKSGDPDAALQLIEDLAFEFLRGLRGVFPAGTIFVSPYAKEATGDNALPLILSLMCAELLNGESETDIVQLQRVFHTGADPMERLLVIEKMLSLGLITVEQAMEMEDLTPNGSEGIA